MSQLLKQLTEKRNALLTEMSTIALGKEINPEQRSKFTTIQADVAILEASISAEKQNVEESRAIDAAYNRPPRDGFKTFENVQAEHEKRAFAQWMKFGTSNGYEQRDLGAGTITAPITGGNVLVPSTISSTFVQAKKNIAGLLDAVNSYQTASGNPMSIPMSNDTGNALTLIAEAAANTTDLDPILSNVANNVDSATTKPVLVTAELLQDALFDVSAWLESVLLTRWKRGVNNWISLGNTSNVAALAATGGVTTLNSGVVEYPDLAALYGSLDAEYANSPSAVFVMSTATRANLMGITSTTGQPILQADANGNPFNSLFGKNIVIDDNRPSIATAGNKPILFGDLKEGYSFRVAGGFNVRRFDELFGLHNQVAFVLYTRVGGAVTNAGTNPIVALTMHA